jgi:L-alanine-DL-glutamate epimerase-like enolase superfamily enzyme
VKIVGFDTVVVNMPYIRREVSSRLDRAGVSIVLVKLTTDDGSVGWGESCNSANAAMFEEALKSARPLVLGRDPWQSAAIARDFYTLAEWDEREPTGNYVFAAIDQALWDLCGKAAGQPLYRLLGGALRPEVDYFYYLDRGTPDEMEAQGRDGRARGYRVYYLKVGIDRVAETAMLQALRAGAGPEARIRVDANGAWSVNEAVKILTAWERDIGLDFCEDPVLLEPPHNMREVRQRTSVAISANVVMQRQLDVLRLMRSGCADTFCFSPYFVGTIQRFVTLAKVGHLDGLAVCKHTNGELGIAAAAAQHVMLSLPNTALGNQHTATMMAGDVIAETLPIATGPRWGAIEAPGLGVTVDEEKVALAHEAWRRDGQYLPYRPDAIGS